MFIVADDDRINRLFLQKLLERMGHAVVCVKDGGQAMNQLETNRFSAAFLDINMPVLSGLEIANRVRMPGHLNEDIVLLALTGMDREHHQEMNDAGFDKVIIKPIDFSELRESINILMQG